ncbi:hypothetical protein AQJ66_24440 [Streptomyces bungoensis]|uniref:Uncharacterized protein n=1 Tax=Streptomyces bungoensis TaxID=285568 RepID=A0A117RB55_9ACTN|nr:hypothetical protein AQJ66_24440 [Streptomyces bungoensis]
MEWVGLYGTDAHMVIRLIEEADGIERVRGAAERGGRRRPAKRAAADRALHRDPARLRRRPPAARSSRGHPMDMAEKYDHLPAIKLLTQHLAR